MGDSKAKRGLSKPHLMEAEIMDAVLSFGVICYSAKITNTLEALLDMEALL